LLAGPLAELKARLDASLRVAAWGAVATLASVVALLFFCVAFFTWLAQQYGPITAGLVLGGIFLLITLITGVICMAVRRKRVKTRVKEASAGSTWWQDPALLLTGLQIARMIGVRRLVPIAIIGGIAAGLLGGQKPSGTRPKQARTSR
jgi:Ca2+/Na+ antiporter